jgi:hypothetical protein
MSTASFHRPLSELITDCDGITTVRELLYRLVRAEIERASDRQLKRSAILPISLEELERMLVEGRAGSAELPKPARVDSKSAIEVILDAFMDGLILLFVDEHRCTRLNQSVEAKPETRVMIVRRTMLTG